MYRFRGNYWSCSKFAVWFRKAFGNIPKLEFGTSEEWAAWKKNSRKNSKFVYWFTETFLTKLQNFLCYPIDVWNAFRIYIQNRFVDHTHYLHTGLKAGQYHELDEALLHGMFQELVDFIEIEKAWMQVVWNDEARTQYKLPWWRSWRCIRFKRWRCPEAGLAHLDWETKLTYGEDFGIEPDNELFGKLTHQAEAALEQLRLYNWWKNVYPNRPDPHEASGWSALCDRRREQRKNQEDEDDDDFLSELLQHKTDADREETRITIEKSHEIEQQYIDEETDMMCSLIRIRKSLWT